jgi:hypothetical protein
MSTFFKYGLYGHYFFYSHSTTQMLTTHTHTYPYEYTYPNPTPMNSSFRGVYQVETSPPVQCMQTSLRGVGPPTRRFCSQCRRPTMESGAAAMDSATGDPIPSVVAPPWSPPPATQFPTPLPRHGVHRCRCFRPATY